MLMRSRWAAIGAAVAVSLGAGSIGMVAAQLDSGDRPVTVTISPERVLDTRSDLGLVGPFLDQTPRELVVTGSVPVASGGSKVVVPAGATSVLVNVTVVNPTAPGWMSLRPGGSAGMPTTSTVNFTTGSVEPNAATVDLGPGGTVQVYVFGASADVLLDIVGYTIHHTHDDRYLSAKEDSFFYVPASLLEVHFMDGPADVYFDNSSDAIVRKTGSADSMKVIIPIPLPNVLGGHYAKLVNFRVSYKVDNVNSYIDHTWLSKSNNTGGHVYVAQSSADRKSTAYTSYLVECTDPGCQLAWVPNGNYLTVMFELKYGGTGDPHDITIGGVLMRVSYDG